MDDNVYKAPEADLIHHTDGINDDDLYVVSIKKFTVLFLSTMGAYSLYWFYKNWKRYNDKHNLGFWPVARAIFAIFFMHQLLNNVDEKLKEKNIEFYWRPGLLATIYVLIAIFDKVTDRLPYMEGITNYLIVLSFLFIGVYYAIFLKSQKAINISQNDTEGDSNSELTLANYIWIVLGLSLWFFSIAFILSSFGLIDIELFNQI